MSTLAIGFALLAFGASPEPAPLRFEAAFLAGAVMPLGDAVPNGPLRDRFAALIPLRLNAGLRLSPATSIGLFGEYGVGLPPRGCVQCEQRVLGFGVELVSHLRPEHVVDPWFAVGAGIEAASRTYLLRLEPGADRSFEDLLGPMLEVQFGVGFPVGSFSLGPWVGLRVGAFIWHSSGVLDQGSSASTSDTTVHAWLRGGVRVARTF